MSVRVMEARKQGADGLTVTGVCGDAVDSAPRQCVGMAP